MRILFIAPLPPPITGHSLASKVLYDYLKERHEITLIDLSKNSFKGGIDSFQRIIEVIKILIITIKNAYRNDVIYLTISESLAGNIKDLFIYLICIFKLDKIYIHLHGGSIQKSIFDKSFLLFYINKLFIKRLGGVVVLGDSHIRTFSNFVDSDRIFVVPNFAEDDIFLCENDVISKQLINDKLNILFLSNMQPEKGFLELFQAFLLLENKYKIRLNLDFAGKFECENDEKEFISLISGYENIKYHGVVKGKSKIDLLSKSHIFCLPTSFLEGQPVSILEAYAAGCFVLTTMSGGIVDIFSNTFNGFTIERSDISIKNKIVDILDNTSLLGKVGLFNRNLAYEKFRTSIYRNNILKILESKYNV